MDRRPNGTINNIRGRTFTLIDNEETEQRKELEDLMSSEQYGIASREERDRLKKPIKDNINILKNEFSNLSSAQLRELDTSIESIQLADRLRGAEITLINEIKNINDAERKITKLTTFLDDFLEVLTMVA